MTEFAEWGREIVIALVAGVAGVVGWLLKRQVGSYDKTISSHETRIAALEVGVKSCATHADIESLRQQELRALERDVKNLGEKFSQVVRDEIQQLRHEQGEFARRQDEFARRQDERFDRLFALLVDTTK